MAFLVMLVSLLLREEPHREVPHTELPHSRLVLPTERVEGDLLSGARCYSLAQRPVLQLPPRTRRARGSKLVDGGHRFLACPSLVHGSPVPLLRLDHRGSFVPLARRLAILLDAHAVVFLHRLRHVRLLLLLLLLLLRESVRFVKDALHFVLPHEGNHRQLPVGSSSRMFDGDRVEEVPQECLVLTCTNASGPRICTYTHTRVMERIAASG